MTKTRETISTEQRWIVIAGAEDLKNRKITSRELAAKAGIKSHTSVLTIIKRYEETESVEDRPRSGAPPISTERDQRRLVSIVKKDRTASSTTLANVWKLSNGKTASPATVRRVLHKKNYKWRTACKKPRLNKKQRKQRVEFCKSHKNWTKSMWRSVVFTDEMNVEVDNRKNTVKLRRMPEERMHDSCLLKRTKQGSGSIGIWACMSYNGMGFFTLFGGRLNAVAYLSILEDSLLPSLDLLNNGTEMILQQDNAPCHKAKIVTDWLAEQHIQTMEWPPNSPDLNCIENLWSWLDKQLSKERICNVEELSIAITKHLNAVPTEIVQNLVDSMPDRITECLKAHGGSTRY